MSGLSRNIPGRRGDLAIEASMTTRQSAVARWAPFVLRLIVGFGFLMHGYAKLSKGPAVFGGLLEAMAVPAPQVMAWLTVAVELVGGGAMLAGAFVRLLTVPMAVVMLVAMFAVHLRYGFSSIKLLAVTPAGAQFGPPGYEVNLLYLACLAALVLAGPGPLALDGLLFRPKTVRE